MVVTQVTIKFENGTKRIHELKGERNLTERIVNCWKSACLSNRGKPFSIVTKTLV